MLGQPLQYLCQPLSAWSFCRQKVQADSLPHVVCLKCDPDEVIAMLRKGLTHKVKKDCISNNKKNKHTEQCLRLYLDLFRATQPSCIFKALKCNKAGLDCSVRWACCDWKKKILLSLFVTLLRCVHTTEWDWASASGWCRMKPRKQRRFGTCQRLDGERAVLWDRHSERL